MKEHKKKQYEYHRINKKKKNYIKAEQKKKKKISTKAQGHENAEILKIEINARPAEKRFVATKKKHCE